MPFCLNLFRYVTLVSWIPIVRGGGGPTGQHHRKIVHGKFSWEEHARGNFVDVDEIAVTEDWGE